MDTEPQDPVVVALSSLVPTGVDSGRLARESGRQLRWVAAGSVAPPVVLISGAGEVGLDWAVVLPPLAERSRVIAYDRAGLGASGPDSLLTLNSQVRDLVGTPGRRRSRRPGRSQLGRTARPTGRIRQSRRDAWSGPARSVPRGQHGRGATGSWSVSSNTPAQRHPGAQGHRALRSDRGQHGPHARRALHRRPGGAGVDHRGVPGQLSHVRSGHDHSRGEPSRQHLHPRAYAPHARRRPPPTYR